MIANGALGGAMLGAAALRFFPPTRYNVYPRCPVYSSLHILCPGCGMTRALAALLRGRIHEALDWNPLAVACMPFALVFLAKCYVRAVDAEEFVWPDILEPWLKVSLVVIAVFTIVRNLHPF
jgi:Protein of unknown function (DUF2752)